MKQISVAVVTKEVMTLLDRWEAVMQETVLNLEK